MAKEQDNAEELRFTYDQLRKEILHIDILTIQILGFILALNAGVISFSAATQGFWLTKGILFFFVQGISYMGLVQSMDRGMSMYKIASYLRMFVEPHMEYMKWETHLQRFRDTKKSSELWYFGQGGFIEYQMWIYGSLIIINFCIGFWYVMKRASMTHNWSWPYFQLLLTCGSIIATVLILLVTGWYMYKAYDHNEKIVKKHDKKITPIWEKVQQKETQTSQ